jgi:ribosome-associated protein
MHTIQIGTVFIRLDAFMKFAALATTGGEAKLMVSDALVGVNGEICTQRGRKLYPGDIVTFGDEEYVISGADDDGLQR